MLNEKDNLYQWTGEKFVLKPMELSRVIVSNLTTEASVIYKKAQLEPYQVVNNLKITIEDGVQNDDSQISAEFVRKELTIAMEEMNENITKKLEELEKLGNAAKTERKTAISDLNKFLETRIKSVEEAGTKQRNLLAKDIQLYKEKWPEGPYCIFKHWDKNCPTGFQSMRTDIEKIRSTSYVFQSGQKNSFFGRNLWKRTKGEKKEQVVFRKIGDLPMLQK